MSRFLKNLHPLIRTTKKNSYNDTNYAILKSIDQVLEDTEKQSIESKNQSFLGKATGKFLDKYGDWFGVFRRKEEKDSNYRERIINQVDIERGTNKAIIQAVRDFMEDPNFPIEIYEPLNNIFYYNKSLWNGTDHYLGSFYRFAVIEVRMGKPFPEDIEKIIDDFKPAGIKVHFTYDPGIAPPDGNGESLPTLNMSPYSREIGIDRLHMMGDKKLITFSLPQSNLTYNVPEFRYSGVRSDLKFIKESGVEEVFTDKAEKGGKAMVELTGKSFQNAGTGKNLINPKEFLDYLITHDPTAKIVSEQGKEVVEFRENRFHEKPYLQGRFKEKTAYTLTITARNAGDVSKATYVSAKYTDGTDMDFAMMFGNPQYRTYKVSTDPLKTIDYLFFSYNTGATTRIQLEDFQIEPGSVATSHEPPAPSDSYPIPIESLNSITIAISNNPLEIKNIENLPKDVITDGVFATQITFSNPLRSVGSVSDRLLIDNQGGWKIERRVGCTSEDGRKTIAESFYELSDYVEETVPHKIQDKLNSLLVTGEETYVYAVGNLSPDMQVTFTPLNWVGGRTRPVSSYNSGDVWTGSYTSRREYLNLFFRGTTYYPETLKELSDNMEDVSETIIEDRLYKSHRGLYLYNALELGDYIYNGFNRFNVKKDKEFILENLEELWINLHIESKEQVGRRFTLESYNFSDKQWIEIRGNQFLQNGNKSYIRVDDFKDILNASSTMIIRANFGNGEIIIRNWNLQIKLKEQVQKLPKVNAIYDRIIE